MMAPLLVRPDVPCARNSISCFPRATTASCWAAKPRSLKKYWKAKYRPKSEAEELFILIDRAAVQHDDEDTQYRLSDSVQTAFFEGEGTCTVESCRAAETAAIILR